MPFSLIPDRLFDAYDQITPELLRAHGVTLRHPGDDRVQ